MTFFPWLFFPLTFFPCTHISDTRVPFSFIFGTYIVHVGIHVHVKSFRDRIGSNMADYQSFWIFTTLLYLRYPCTIIVHIWYMHHYTCPWQFISWLDQRWSTSDIWYMFHIYWGTFHAYLFHDWIKDGWLAAIWFHVNVVETLHSPLPRYRYIIFCDTYAHIYSNNSLSMTCSQIHLKNCITHKTMGTLTCLVKTVMPLTFRLIFQWHKMKWWNIPYVQCFVKRFWTHYISGKSWRN
jgi:hypothetical protein